uniref:Uncharacterized protein n=1 Tax=Cacopsylla melanoneura TaxID=428564 RepID=A0A8D8VUH2_9HEMI
MRCMVTLNSSTRLGEQNNQKLQQGIKQLQLNLQSMEMWIHPSNFNRWNCQGLMETLVIGQCSTKYSRMLEMLGFLNFSKKNTAASVDTMQTTVKTAKRKDT